MPDTSQTKTDTAASKPAANDDNSPLSLALKALAGDNKLIGNLIKTLLSPIGAVIAMCGAGYLLFKNKQYKNQIEKLKTENATLKEKNDELTERYLRAKRRKIEDYEERQSGQLTGSRARRLEKKSKQTFYLD